MHRSPCHISAMTSRGRWNVKLVPVLAEGQGAELWLISLPGTSLLPTVMAAQPYWLPCHGLPLLM